MVGGTASSVIVGPLPVGTAPCTSVDVTSVKFAVVLCAVAWLLICVVVFGVIGVSSCT